MNRALCFLLALLMFAALCPPALAAQDTAELPVERMLPGAEILDVVPLDPEGACGLVLTKQRTVEIRGGGVLVGIDSEGKVHASTLSNRDDAQDMCRELNTWTDVVRLRYREVGYDRKYFLGWQSDGTLLLAGLKLPA